MCILSELKSGAYIQFYLFSDSLIYMVLKYADR